MIKRYFVVLVLTAYSVLLCAEQKPVAPDSVTGAYTVTAEQVIELIISEPEVTIIDSRKNSEYLKGHIEGAISILNTTMTLNELEIYAPDKQQLIVFYCNGSRCLRSSDAVKKALNWGYKNVYWFRGGWKEWLDKKLPVNTNEVN